MPRNIHRSDPLWVAPLFSHFASVLGPTNPFWDHAELAVWVVSRDNRDIGRIAAIDDRTFNQLHGGGTAFFGFFECVDDPGVAAALFETALTWTHNRGLHRVLGPMDPSMNDECGLLVHGFDSPPTVMTPYAPPYYQKLVEASGFHKAKDLFAYTIDPADCPEARLTRLRKIVDRRHPEIAIRPVTRRTLASDIPRIMKLYNAAWDQNWGAVPFTDREITFLVSQLKPLLVDGLVWVAEKTESVVGFLLLLPDANEVIQPLRGRWISPGLLVALPYLIGLRNPRRARLMVLGTSKNLRGRGLEAAMLSEALRVVKRLGMTSCEASWLLEDNHPVLRMVETFGGKHTKTFRIYQRATDPPLSPSTRR
ncbi:MAG: hypothetical protein P8J87_05505 [Verrucomicrobiales bacterium]|nr:hypothetical protein [Verrucomicrobiales bacterium]